MLLESWKTMEEEEADEVWLRKVRLLGANERVKLSCIHTVIIAPSIILLAFYI